MLKQANLSFSVAAQSFGDDVTSIQFSTQDKNTAKLIFTIKEGKQPLNLTDVEGKVDLVMGDKSVFDDNKAVVTAPLDGKLEYTITADQIRHPGRARGELQLISKDGQSIGGFRFNFTIKKALVDEYVGPIKEYYVHDIEALKAEIEATAESIKGIDIARVDMELRDKATKQEIQQVTLRLDDKANKNEVNAKRDKSIPIGLNDAAPDLLTAIQGGTTVEVLSIPKYKSVTPSKTTFFKTSTNLYDKNNLIDNKSIDRATGNLIDNTTTMASHFIDIQGMEKLTVKKSTSFPCNVVYYDSTQAFISGYQVQTSLPKEVLDIPDNAFYIRVSSNKSGIPVLQVNEGDVDVPYEEYRSPTLEADLKIPLDKNNVSISYANDQVKTVSAGGTTVTLHYTNGMISSIVESDSSETVTSTLSYSNGKLTGVNKEVTK